MKTLILLAFMLIANVFAGDVQEIICGDKSLLYCINHFDRQCEAKNYGACFVVGQLHAEQEQYSKAKKYYEMVCDKANSSNGFEVKRIDGSIGMQKSAIETMKFACYDLGEFYYNGWGVRQSYEKSFQYFNKSCDLGDGDGCAGAGLSYYKGEGIERGLNRVIKLITKACELKSGLGCAMLGALYADGKGIEQNISKAKELFGKACDFGDQKGCDTYKELKEKGY